MLKSAKVATVRIELLSFEQDCPISNWSSHNVEWYSRWLGLILGLALNSTVSRASAADNVAGNLITIDNDGMWSWYMDERAIVDPVNGTLLIGANSSSPVRYPTSRPTGSVDLFTYDLATGSRSRFQLSDIDEDDHNARV